MKTIYRATEFEQYVPPPCPKCGSTNVSVSWIDIHIRAIDGEPTYVPGLLNCNDCLPPIMIDYQFEPEGIPVHPVDVTEPERQPREIACHEGGHTLGLGHSVATSHISGEPLPEAMAPRRVGTDCAAHHHRELVPIEAHHIWPKGMQGPDVESNIVRVCSNAHGSIHDLLDKMRKVPGGKVPWAVRRRYGFKIRQLAQRGWEQLPAEYRR